MQMLEWELHWSVITVVIVNTEAHGGLVVSKSVS